MSVLGPFGVAGRPSPRPIIQGGRQEPAPRASLVPRETKAFESRQPQTATASLRRAWGRIRTANRLLEESRARRPRAERLQDPSLPGERICTGLAGRAGRRHHVRRPGPRDSAARPPAHSPAPPLSPPLAGSRNACEVLPALPATGPTWTARGRGWPPR